VNRHKLARLGSRVLASVNEDGRYRKLRQASAIKILFGEIALLSYSTPGQRVRSQDGSPVVVAVIVGKNCGDAIA
jgi:hypothetical protein